MQHFGIPTRLIDITRSQFVALYFAIEDADQTAAIWAFDVNILHAPDRRDRNAIFGLLADPYSWKQRQPQDFIGSDDMRRVAFMQPHMMPERLRNQQGAFLFAFDRSREFLSILDAQLTGNFQNHVKKLVVSTDMRRDVVRLLRSANCEGYSLFPGPDGVGRTLRNLAL